MKKVVAVIGAGAWGTALAAHAARLEHDVRIWAREPEVVRDINELHENRLLLEGVALPPSLRASTDPAEVLDAAVPAGEHTYRVAALDGNAVSPPSPPQSVRTGASWGVYAPLVEQFPELLPQTPDTAAKWNDTECVRRYAGGRDEVGPSETGNGKVRTVFVVRCAAGAVDRPFGVFWFASRDALNAEYSRSSATSRPVRWRHGTGLIDENGRGVFKITDDPARELAMIVVLQTPAQNVLEMVDSMPI